MTEMPSALGKALSAPVFSLTHKDDSLVYVQQWL